MRMLTSGTAKLKVTVFAIALLLPSLLAASKFDPYWRHAKEVEVESTVEPDLQNLFTEPIELLGATCLVPRSPQEVLKRLDSLIEKHPEEPGLYLERSRANYSLSSFEKAEADLKACVNKSKQKADPLRALAEFYEQRLRPRDRLAVYKELFSVLAQNPAENKAELQKLIDDMFYLARSHMLDIDKVKYRRRFVDLYPDDHEAAVLYLEARFEKAGYEELGEEINSYADKFPEHEEKFLELLAKLHFQYEKKEKARQVFLQRLEASSRKEMFFTYLSLLHEWHSYRYEKRLLEDKEEERSTMESALLFHMYLEEGESSKAARVLAQWMEQDETHTARKLRLFAEYARRCAKYELSARLLYTGLPEADREQKGQWLFELFQSLIKARSSAWQWPGGIDSFYHTRMLDPDPGVSGGVLSLLLNGKVPARAFADLAKVEGLHRNLHQAMTVRLEYRRLFPDGDYNAEMDFTILERCEELYFLKRALKEADYFISAYPSEPRLITVKRKRGKALFRLGRDNSAMAQYDSLLVDTFSDLDLYLEILREYASELHRANQQAKKIEVYWREIEVHPQTEEIYRQFLRALSARQHMDRLRLYKKAVEHLSGSDWHSRLARWYLKRKRNREYQAALERSVSVLPPSEISGFVEAAVSTRLVDKWRVLKASLYMAAHRRFPRHEEYMKRYLELMDYVYRKKECPSYLCRMQHVDFAKHVLMDNEGVDGLAGRVLLNKLVQSKKLAKAVRHVSSQSSLNPAEEYFLALALDRQGRYEQSHFYWKSLAKRYPATPFFKQSLAERLAGLADVRPEKFGNGYAESVKLLVSLHQLYPAQSQYPVRIGEILVEQRRYKNALSWWDKLINLAPGLPRSYLSAAEPAWDYFQYGAAAQRIRRGRERLDEPHLFSLEMGAVLEDMGEYEAAIAEYIRGIANREEKRSALVSRLVYLAEYKGAQKQIESAFDDYLSENSGEPGPVKAYVLYLKKMGGNSDKIASVLSLAFDEIQDRDFLLWGKDILEKTEQPRAAEKALLRIIELYPRDYDVRLELLRFYDRQGMPRELNAAAEELRADIKKLKRPEDRIRRLHSFSRVLWEAQEYPFALESLRSALSLARGEQYYALSKELSDKLMKIKDYNEAGGVLSAALSKKGWGPDLFRKLARAYTLQQSSSSLIRLHHRMDSIVKEVAQGRTDRRSKLSILHKTIADSLAQTDRKTQALDYYIEWINQDAENLERTRTAWRFAKRHGLTDRIIEYYNRAAKKAHKDYRWSLVQGRLLAWNGEPEKAVPAYELAIRNEPGKLVLYKEAIVLFKGLQRYKDAARMYKSLSALDWQHGSYKIKALRMYFLSGDHKRAKEEGSLILEGAPAMGFRVGLEYERAGEIDDALKIFDRTIPLYINDRHIGKSDLAAYIRIHGEAGKIRQVFAKLEDAYEQADKNFRLMFLWSISNKLGDALVEWGTPRDRQWAREWLETKMAEGKLPDKVLYEFAQKAGFSSSAFELLAKLPEKKNYMEDYPSPYRFWRDRFQWSKAYQSAGKSDYESVNALLWMGEEKRALDRMGALYNSGGLGPWDRQFLDFMIRHGRQDLMREYLDDSSRMAEEANFFLETGRPRLAERTLESADRESWSVAKLLLVKLSTNDYLQSFIERVRKTLRMFPAGERMDIEWDENSQLRYHEQAVLQMKFAEYLYRAGERYEASEIWYAAIEDSPRSFEAYRFTGWLLLRLDENKEAADIFANGLDLEPGNLSLLHGNALAKKRNLEQKTALRTFRSMAGETPASTEPVSRKLYQFYSMLGAGYKEEAISSLELWIRAGYASEDEQDREDAFRALKAYARYACKTSPEAPPRAFRELVMELVSGNPDDTELARAIINNGWVRTDKLDDVYTYLVRTLEKEDVDASFLQNWKRKRLVHWLSHGRYNKVISFLNQQEVSLELKEVPLENVELRVRALLKKDMVPQADAYFKKWIEVKGESSETLDQVAEIYLAEGFTKKAAEVLERKWELVLADPLASPEDYLSYAEFLLEQDEKDRAWEVINRLLYRHPDDIDALEEAASVLELHKDYARAVVLRKRIIKLNADGMRNRIETVIDLCRDEKMQKAADLVVKSLYSPVWGRSDRHLLIETLERRLSKREGELLSAKLVPMLKSELRKAEQRKPSSLLALAAAHLLGGHNQAFDNTIDKAMKIEPAYVAPLACRFYLSAGNYEVARNICLQGLHSFPDDARLPYRLALAYLGSDGPDKALALSLVDYDLAEARYLQSFSSHDSRKSRSIWNNKQLSYNEKRQLKKQTLTRNIIERLLGCDLPSEEKVELLRGLADYLEDRGAYDAAEYLTEELVEYLSPGAPHYYKCEPCSAMKWKRCGQESKDYPATVRAFQKSLDRLSEKETKTAHERRHSLKILNRLDNGIQWKDVDLRLTHPESWYMRQ